MQDKPIQDEQATDRLRAQDHQRAVIELLVSDSALWTVDEVVREVSSPELDVIDAIAALQGFGLVHRYDDVVFPTRAARQLDEIGLL
jgi:hypothetical protein